MDRAEALGLIERQLSEIEAALRCHPPETRRVYEEAGCPPRPRAAAIPDPLLDRFGAAGPGRGRVERFQKRYGRTTFTRDDKAKADADAAPTTDEE